MKKIFSSLDHGEKKPRQPASFGLCFQHAMNTILGKTLLTTA